MKNRKGQTGGLITGLVFGIASLVIGVIIAFVIVSTLSGADLLEGTRTSATTTNESGGFINATGYTLANFDSDTTKAISITQAVNATDGDGTVIASGNYTLDTSTGIVTNASDTTWADVNFTYSVTTESAEEAATDNLDANFSAGVNNVSEQIPTVLLVAAIVLILAVLAILIGVWQRMRMGGGSVI
jgi:hypothetical protein